MTKLNDKPVNFQWQNDALRKTIYPLRETKLHDFLVYFYEIEIWEDNYCKKELEDIPEEVAAYQKSQQEKWNVASHNHSTLKEYFVKEDVTDEFKRIFPNPDEKYLHDIKNNIHKRFSVFYSKDQSIRREKNFLVDRISWLEGYRKGLQDELSEEKRTLKNNPNHWRKVEIDERIQQLDQVTLKMAQMEIQKLNDYFNALVKLENRRAELTGADEVTVRDIARGRVEDFKNLLAASDGLTMPVVANDDITLMTVKSGDSNLPPQFVPLINNGRSKKMPVGFKFRVSLLDQVANFEARDGVVDGGRSGKHYQVFSSPDDRGTVGYFVPVEKVDEIDGEKLLEFIVSKFLDDPTGYPLWLQYMVIHFSGMRYQSAHGSWADARDLLVPLARKAAESEIAQASEEAIEILSQEKIRIYEVAITQGADSKSIQEGSKIPLLAQTEDPQWKAKWQAHIEKLKSSVRRAKAAPKMGMNSIFLYRVGGGNRFVKSSTEKLPRGAEFTVGTITSRGSNEYYCIEEYTDNPLLEGRYVLDEDVTLIPDPNERKTLLDLRIDEENYENERIDDEQVLADLEKVKDGLKLPPWMWNEIVRMTELRLKTKNKDWEQPTEDEIDARNDIKSTEYRLLMNEWKKENLTVWREEHEQSNRLIVTRAVCNEVAEHIQHLRGQKPPGGLTAKPEWYLREERNPHYAARPDRPYLVKPKVKEHFTVGASILWLRFVNSQPNAWRIAYPLTLKDGSGLLTPGLKLEKRVNMQRLRRELKVKTPNASTDWFYTVESGRNFKRYRVYIDQNGSKVNDDQWLRWMHEATVAAVGETADGPVVLTFETALPYEDKRRSTIGVFRHTVNGLRYNVSPSTFIGSFVGYVPYGDIPVEELRTMLDWDKILPGNNFSAEKKQKYWAAIEGELARIEALRRDDPGIMPGSGDIAGSPVEVALSIAKSNHKEWTPGYEIDPIKNRARMAVPRVELRRGTRVYVDKENPITSRLFSRDIQLYRITRCDLEPRAEEGLYIDAGAVMEVPIADEGKPDPASKPVLAKEKILLRTIKGLNKNMYPIVELYYRRDRGKKSKVMIKAGTPFRVSTIHKITQGDRGDGVIRGDSSLPESLLIVECPGDSRAVGFLVPKGEVDEISEDRYKLKITQPEVETPQELEVRAAPRKNKQDISLFKKAGRAFKPTGSSLPAGAIFEVDPTPEFLKGKNYYRIISCPADRDCFGLYANVKDVCPILRVMAAAKNGGGSIPLFKDGGKTLSQGETVPQNAEIIVDPVAVFDQDVGYYCIVDYPQKPVYVGRLVKVEDVVVPVAKPEAVAAVDRTLRDEAPVRSSRRRVTRPPE